MARATNRGRPPRLSVGDRDNRPGPRPLGGPPGAIGPGITPAGGLTPQAARASGASSPRPDLRAGVEGVAARTNAGTSASEARNNVRRSTRSRVTSNIRANREARPQLPVGGPRLGNRNLRRLGVPAGDTRPAV